MTVPNTYSCTYSYTTNTTTNTTTTTTNTNTATRPPKKRHKRWRRTLHQETLSQPGDSLQRRLTYVGITILSMLLQRVAATTDSQSTTSAASVTDDLLIVSTVDGTLAGLSKANGQLLWVQPGQSSSGTLCSSNQKESYSDWGGSHGGARTAATSSSSVSSCRLLDPLVSTTTTTAVSSNQKHHHALHAVPSIDGSVYLTHGDVTLKSHVQDLLLQSPFVDAGGRLYTARKSSSVTAMDPATGDIVAVYDHEHWKQQQPGPQYSNSNEDEQLGQETWIWMGRNDYQVSIHEPRSINHPDVSFTISELLSVDDMLLDAKHQPQWRRQTHENGQARDHFVQGIAAATASVNMAPTRLLSTPSGVCAYYDDGADNTLWTHQLASPVVYAIDAITGKSLHIDMIPDAKIPEKSEEYFMEALQQLTLSTYKYSAQDTEESYADIDASVTSPSTVVGTLANGQIYAMPLRSHVSSRAMVPMRSLETSSKAHHAATPSRVPAATVQTIVPSQTMRHGVSPEVGRSSSTSSSVIKKSCGPGHSGFPACLIDQHRSQDQPYIGSQSYQSIITSHGDVNPYYGDVQDHAVIPLYHPNYGYLPPDNHFYTEQMQMNHGQYNFLRILGSWLPPTIALIFVVSFELGRRKRQRDLKAKQPAETKNENANSTDVGMIHIQKDTILGYGGHGTVVYRGTLEGREVAVKRMLKAYHASADREISLLIESDGHPNVVRYFLKEVRGDFVYLALELCDLSLHDLIAVLRTRYDETYKPSRTALPYATKIILLQIANGVMHLHRLRIVHRDLKPANILLADSKKNQRKKRKEEDGTVFSTYQRGDFIAKISDMGLGKQLLMGQSSFGGSTLNASLRGQSNTGQSSLAVAGPGSVGWQAPEVMAIRVTSDTSVKSDGSCAMNSLSEASPADHASNCRTSRSSDIFSLGCVFYSALLPGSHPFGEWFERESNIMHNRPSTGPLEAVSPEAHDLVKAMIDRNPSNRPTAREVCDHPFFWSPSKRLAFVCEFSDRLESDATLVDGVVSPISLSKLLAVERSAVNIVGASWVAKLDEDLISNVHRFRSYDPTSIRDLLRLIRNKYHHFDELPETMKIKMNRSTEGLMSYFEERFPSIVIHCYRAAGSILTADDSLLDKFSIHSQVTDRKMPSSNRAHIAQPPPIVSSESPSDNEPGLTDDVDVKALGTESVESVFRPNNCYDDTEPASLMIIEANIPEMSDEKDIIIWEGSTTAKTLHCRGWQRPDNEWMRCVDTQLRKRDKNLVRCAEDPKFRTRLCNHWDESQGTFCPMRKKGKCVFAHGPVELRVKEGKRNRWGKLVDKNGDNKNAKHSGGEDTYGAARSIETERKQEGKWNTANMTDASVKSKSKEDS